ncbi:hypothetical protein MNEG_0476 [Monoraphidium neglectum]|uniref:C2 NT-type domain-containing protein n=1 Tax=Monoraphidium neglectum TaxID=145388 RepID=A0A0D2NTF2_9CHLO|nr:hypothetical protein MNEG_0476 [Monoraphidium neglectum]KIZ07466.1 hypothetical protein MNEG_0476 [Monoraphidium neglectum]|eukprot:XP_013906485.1 hypothetical protein MNEG_0476 [Monoraphidium neglectum]
MLPRVDAAAAQHGSGARSGRKLVDMAQKARGRTPLKYEVTIIPFFCGELPSGLDRLSFVWERGSKVFATEPEPVNPHTKACFWQQYLRQTITVYQDGGVFVPKEYTLKVQAVRARGRGAEDRRTVGKVKVDLAAFCNAEVEPLPREVFLQLKPVGKLKLSIKAGWLKGAAIDLDALTEASFYTQRSGEEADHCGGGTARSHFGAGEDEQDLSGFEGVAAAGHVGSTGAVGTPAAGARGGAGGATAAGRQQQPQPQGQQGAAASLPVTQQHKGSPLATISSPANSATGGSPRIAAAAVGGGARPKLPGEIAQFEVPLSAEEQREEVERQKRKVMEAAEQHIAAMRRDMEDALRTELVLAMQSQRTAWWQALCCCWPRRQAYARPTNEVATVEIVAPGAAVPLTCADL